jgi:hypothetical protein
MVQKGRSKFSADSDCIKLTENFEPLFAKIEWLIISLAYMIKFG